MSGKMSEYMNEKIAGIVFKYFSIVTIAIKDRAYHPGRLVVQTIAYFVRVGILIMLYAYAFRYAGGSMLGVDVATAAWSMSAYFVFLSLQMRGIFQNINEDVKSGAVEALLSKPISYLWYRGLFQFGSGFLNGVISLIAALLFLVPLVGLPSLSFDGLWLVRFGVIACLGTILAGLIYTAVGLCAFWIENARPVYWIVDKSIMVLGGSYIPVALFPHHVRALAEYSPFGASMFVTHAFYQDFSEKWVILVIMQLTWVACTGVLVSYLYRRARRVVSINGG